MTYQQSSDAPKCSLLSCNQEINKSHYGNQHSSLCPVKDTSIAFSLGPERCAQRELQEPEMSKESVIMNKNIIRGNEALQLEEKRKKTQLLPARGNLLGTNSSLLAVPCEILPEIEHHGLQNPFNSCQYKGINSATVSRSMDFHFHRQFSMAGNISNSKHPYCQHDPSRNIAHTDILPNTDSLRSINMEFRHPVLTFSSSSSAIKSSTCEASQLGTLLESPSNCLMYHSSKHPLFQMGDELSAALISGFRSSLRKTDSEIQNEIKQNCSFHQVELPNEQGSTLGGVQEFNPAPNISEAILDSDSGLSFFSELNEDLLEAVVAGVPSNRKLESGFCSATIDEISSQLGSSDEVNLADNNKIAGYSLGEITQALSSTELRKSTNANNTNESTSMVHNLLKHSSGGFLEGECLNEYKQEDIPKNVRRRGKQGETVRPRPKDRQQIQDRVRELRDIVPNGDKCSIDALLERTIKYVKFLHRVTQNVGRWSYKGKIKIAGNEAIAVLPKGSESGASWAIDLDANGEIQERHFPIIVENLGQPGQMLVEILCEDKGIFLEIANNIRGLGLTILKGVMEVRNKHFWGRFVVEAVRDIHRVEVLWSLAHILELVANNGTNTRISNSS